MSDHIHTRYVSWPMINKSILLSDPLNNGKFQPCHYMFALFSLLTCGHSFRNCSLPLMAAVPCIVKITSMSYTNNWGCIIVYRLKWTICWKHSAGQKHLWKQKQLLFWVRDPISELGKKDEKNVDLRCREVGRRNGSAKGNICTSMCLNYTKISGRMCCNWAMGLV